MSTKVETKSNFVMSGLIFVELREVERNNQKSLYFAKFACPKTYGNYSSMAFLENPELVKTHVGKTVSVEFAPGSYEGRDTLTVTNIIPE